MDMCQSIEMARRITRKPNGQNYLSEFLWNNVTEVILIRVNHKRQRLLRTQNIDDTLQWSELEEHLDLLILIEAAATTITEAILIEMEDADNGSVIIVAIDIGISSRSIGTSIRL